MLPVVIGVLDETIHQIVKAILRPNVVGVQERDHPTGGEFQAGIAGRRRTPVGLRDNLYVSIKTSDAIGGAVGGAIVNDNDLKRFVVLGADAFDGVTNE